MSTLPAPATRSRPLAARLARVVKCLRRAARRYRQRRDLADLDDRLLADIGISRARMEAECRKPPWR